ncbi:MAG: NAD(P)/FAD-dependent oxidoreductase [Kordiimonadaceae bacterium]|nr:NAD(P)/FAD-dependent oxidoreductase [Kordiimonadaceae bacterium]
MSKNKNTGTGHYSDKELGMDRKIIRRDFLSGASIAVTGAILCPSLVRAMQALDQNKPMQSDPDYYPPAKAGMRGSHDGSFETAHKVRDGETFSGKPNGEKYDLVVVGGGISGLSAAWFYRQSAGPDAKILILDNHDDFGGHAKRNEYMYNGQKILVNGGTLNIEQPTNYSTVAMSFLRELGIDTDAYHEKTKDMIRHHRNIGLGGSTFFDKETFGGDGLVKRDREAEDGWDDFFDKAPLTDKLRAEYKRLYSEKIVAKSFQGLSDKEKKRKLAGMSYAQYVTEELGVDAGVLPLYSPGLHFRFYVGAEQVPALFCWQLGGMPGFDHLELKPTPKISPMHHIAGSQHGREHEYREDSIYFPDGNATITRMTVRQLIPEAIPGHSIDDIFMAKVDYSRLDRPENPTRLRLNSTAIKVKHNGDPETAKDVDVTYMQGGKAETVKSRNVIYACWHNVIPYICDDYSEKQKEAMLYGIKAPRVYTNVLLRDGKAFEKLGTSSITSPGLYHTSTSLHFPFDVGGYKAPQNLDEPVVVKMHRAPCAPGELRREQLRLGRYDLLNTPFETFERNIREQLQRMLGSAGFDAARDIVAITVNRWPHGNAYAYDTITEPYEWSMYPTDDRPCVVARQQLGRMSVANSDADASPFTDAAIDQAHRAVREVLADQYLMDNA